MEVSTPHTEQTDSSVTLATHLEPSSQVQATLRVNTSADVENVVILKSNPIDLPMVCGLCGSQYATARELECHMNEHRPGSLKRGRGRPKGSLNKTKVVTPQVTESLSDITRLDEELSTSPTRKSRRPVKKPNTDLYVHDEKELDELIGPVSTRLAPFTKESLPRFNEAGVPIARVEDFMTQTLYIEKAAQPEGLTEADLMEGGIIDAPTASTEDFGQQQSAADQVDTTKTLLPLSQEIQQSQHEQAAPAASTALDTTTAIDLPDETSEVNSNENDNITHIEVCLESFIGNIQPKNGDDNSNKDEDMMCELCGQVLSSSNMKNHMTSSHMNQTTSEFVCPHNECSELFDTIPKLRQHMVQNHPTSNTVMPTLQYQTKSAKSKPSSNSLNGENEAVNTTCHVCNKIFKSKRAHSSHMKAHTKVLEPVSCNKCHKEFRHSSALKFHNSMMPECDKPKYVCDMCGYKAVTPWRLQSHQMQVHSNDRPYTCQYCNKAYKTKEMLKQHVYKLHTGTPKHECQVCGKKFFYAAELREHGQLHNSTKEFVCPICNRAFKTMHVFRGHMNGKHSDTWYSCGFCKFTTSHKKSMKRHMVLVHKLKNVTLEVTPEETPTVIPQQVEIIQADDIQLTETGQVIGSVHVQYDSDVSQVVMHSEGEVISHEPIEEGIHHLITPHTQSDVTSTMNASEVSQVLVSLSEAGVSEHVMVEELNTAQ